MLGCQSHTHFTVGPQDMALLHFPMGSADIDLAYVHILAMGHERSNKRVTEKGCYLTMVLSSMHKRFIWAFMDISEKQRDGLCLFCIESSKN